ncbi:hypothetical protein FACS1894178_9420 [Bacteroidia bacterium]|nr:hypothetical protein FACS1894178_9420 [Bacteroidia bacterium]
MKKWIYIVAVVLLLAATGVTITFGALYSNVKKTLKYERENAAKQQELIEKLGAMDGIHATINVNMTVKNTAVMGKVSNGDYDFQPVIESTFRYLRKELVQQDTVIISKNPAASEKITGL